MHAAGEDRIEPGRAAEQGVPPGRVSRLEGPSVGREKPADGRPFATEWPGGDPACPHRRFGSGERLLVSAAAGHHHPGIEGGLPRGRDQGQAAKRVCRNIAWRRIGQPVRKPAVGLTVGDPVGAGPREVGEQAKAKQRQRPAAGDGEGLFERGIAGGRVAGGVVCDRGRVARDPAQHAPARLPPHQPAIDGLERGLGCLPVASRGRRLSLHRHQPGPQRGRSAPRAIGCQSERWRHAPQACQMVGGPDPVEGLLQGPHVAVVGGRVGRFLEVFHRLVVAIGIEGDPSQDDQSPGGERMIELIAHEQAAGKQRPCLVRLALGPEGGAERDVDPGLRVVVGRRRPFRQAAGGGLERRIVVAEVAHDAAEAIGGHHEAADDLLGTDRPVVVGGEHAPPLKCLLHIGGLLPNRHSVRHRRRHRVAFAPPPGGRAGSPERLERLLRKLHRQQPLGVGRLEVERFLVAGHRLAISAEFEQALAHHRRRSDRVDPAVGTDPNAAGGVPLGEFEGRRVVARGEGLERQIVARPRNQRGPRRQPHRWRQHHLRPGCGSLEAERDDENTAVHAGGCTPSGRGRAARSERTPHPRTWGNSASKRANGADSGWGWSGCLKFAGRIGRYEE